MSKYRYADNQIKRDYLKVNLMFIGWIILFILVITFINVTEKKMKTEADYMANAVMTNTPILQIVHDDVIHATFDDVTDLEYFLNGMYEDYKTTAMETSDNINIYIFDKQGNSFKTYITKFVYAYNGSIKITDVKENN